MNGPQQKWCTISADFLFFDRGYLAPQRGWPLPLGEILAANLVQKELDISVKDCTEYLALVQSGTHPKGVRRGRSPLPEALRATRLAIFVIGLYPGAQPGWKRANLEIRVYTYLIMGTL